MAMRRIMLHSQDLKRVGYDTLLLVGVPYLLHV